MQPVHISRTNVNELSSSNQLELSFGHSIREGISCAREIINILCLFYMNQLPLELLIDSERLCYWLKLEKTHCLLMSHVFGMSSIKYIETLWNRYAIIGFSVKNHKLSKAAIMKNIWNTFDTLLSA